jgi:hypothetical protein
MLSRITHSLTQDVVVVDFCYGFLSFSPSIALKVPGGLSFDLMHHWDGQPARFVCCERRKASDGEPWDRMFWCVSFEFVDENEMEFEGEVD